MDTPLNLRYRADIQGLRAIAIVLVVLGHAGIPGFDGGFVGVDVFFVLSGYLITGLLLQEWISSGGIHLAGFLSRRLKRLLPALLVMLGLTLPVAGLLLSALEVQQQSTSAVYAATWTSNLYFALATVDYFAELQTRDLFLHTWSLGVEEQFYLLWPPLLLLVLKGMGGPGTRLSPRLSWGLGGLLVASLGLCWYWSLHEPLWAFYLMPARIWQFALGAGVFVWLHHRTPDARGAFLPQTGCGVVGLGLILASGMMLHPDLRYPGYWALLPSLGTALLLMAGHGGGNRGVPRWLGHPLPVWLGDRSYSWYLWHWPVQTLGETLDLAQQSSGRLGLIALSLLLAMLSYRWVELPFWRGRAGAVAPMRINLAALLAMLLMIFGIRHLQPPPAVGADPALHPLLTARVDFPAIYSRGCDSWYRSAVVVPCVFGPPEAPRTVVLLGDSIGAQWFSLVSGIFRAPTWRTVVLTKSSCPMVDEDFFYRRIGQVYTVCAEWREAVLERLALLRPDMIFVGNTATYDFSEHQWIEGSARVLARLSAVAGQVIVLPGTPKLSFDGPGCLMRNGGVKKTFLANLAPSCQEAADPRAARVSGYLQRVTRRFANASLLDLNERVCPDRHCAARHPDGVVVFRDSQHLTDTFVRRQIPWVQTRLRRLGLVANP